MESEHAIEEFYLIAWKKLFWGKSVRQGIKCNKRIL